MGFACDDMTVRCRSACHVLHCNWSVPDMYTLYMVYVHSSTITGACMYAPVIALCTLISLQSAESTAYTQIRSESLSLCVPREPRSPLDPPSPDTGPRDHAPVATAYINV